jgi:NAD(P) transhydrogenase
LLERYDICVLGSGPGGQKAAIQAAKQGSKVCIVERMEMVGGVAIHTGTIPSKALRQAIIQATRGRDHLDVRADVKSGKLVMGELLSACQRIIAVEMEIVRGQLRRNGVEVVVGEGSFEDPHTIVVRSHEDVTRLHADKVLIAVGTEPRCPSFIPFDQECIITSDDIIKLRRLPESLVVVGGGVIGTEFGSMFARLGVRVTMVSRGPRVLNFLDLQIGEALQYHMRQRGMVLRFCEELSRVERISAEQRGDGGEHPQVVTLLKSGKELRSDAFLYCQGRRGVVEPLNLAAAGLEADTKRGHIEVNENFQTAQPHIYAVGDVVGFPALASTSMNQGRMAACHMNGKPMSQLREYFPFGIYSVPEISMVGDNEEQLTEKGVPYETGVANYKEIARGQLLGDDVGMLKILFHPQTKKVLGVHILGTTATELIHIGQAVMALDATVDYFIDSAFNYPTLAECYRVAALNGLNKLQEG